jgi:glutaconate CoA-transferase subunit B
MVVAAARFLRDDDVCFVGIGVPTLAAVLAKRTHAPGLTLLYESGVIDTIPPVPPLSTGSPSVYADTAFAGDCLSVFGALQAGRVSVGILSGAQLDRRGNLNSTVIGEYARPKVRLVGSGGAHDIAVLAGRVLILMPHDARRFVEQVDFVTSPGHPVDAASTALVGGGPEALITPRAVFAFDDGEMTLAAVQAGFTPEEASEGFPWTPPHRGRLDEIAAPDPDVLAVLRTRVGGAS